MSGFSGPSLAGNVNIGGDLTWVGAAQTTWTPTVTAQTPGGTPPTFSTTTAQYKKFGKMVVFNIEISVTAAGTGSNGILITMPSSTSGVFTASGREGVNTGSALSVQTASASSISVRAYNNVTLIATGADIIVGGFYFE